MTRHLYAEWRHLVGAIVEIRHKGIIVRVGYVDDVMPDASILWLAAELSQPRSMYEAAQGFSVWTDHSQVAERRQLEIEYQHKVQRRNGSDHLISLLRCQITGQDSLEERQSILSPQ